ncbi:hypothetical protein [Jannaschia pohangensis]|uniref:Uncharacterized protein n=1 Tax=Jannaschia pohangensis TaxID=390807 RepID=A0A1I3QVQ3_9RHOB|nr:hypothetical protein [Jannaschia pohangensis]SFJ37589.1 hypothetical protein SAMN04488095_2671 [Jannaschia pohangensis]
MTVADVWFASSSVSTRSPKPIWPIGWHDEDLESMSSEEKRQFAIANKANFLAYRSGQPVEPAQLGTRFALCTGLKTPAGPQPFMLLFSRMVVTGETRALLEELDPGPLRFHRIEVLNAARTKPLWDGADLYVMQVLSCRREVLMDESPNLGPRPVDRTPDGQDIHMVYVSSTMEPLVVVPPAEGGAEMWLDDRLSGALFLTDRVAGALNAAKLTRGWGLRRCDVVTRH